MAPHPSYMELTGFLKLFFSLKPVAPVLLPGGDPSKAVRSLRSIVALGTVANRDLYEDFQAEARKRLAARDPNDWPILAAALALDCPIWTEDTDFFGCGVATWTSASIDSFLTN